MWDSMWYQSFFLRCPPHDALYSCTYFQLGPRHLDCGFFRKGDREKRPTGWLRVEIGGYSLLKSNSRRRRQRRERRQGTKTQQTLTVTCHIYDCGRFRVQFTTVDALYRFYHLTTASSSLDEIKNVIDNSEEFLEFPEFTQLPLQLVGVVLYHIHRLWSVAVTPFLKRERKRYDYQWSYTEFEHLVYRELREMLLEYLFPPLILPTPFPDCILYSSHLDFLQDCKTLYSH
jgi:hypothetical protein